MFRQEKPVLPFNEIHHLTGESFGFAVNLRRDVKEKAAAEEVRKVPAPNVVASKVGPDGKRVKDEFAVKETNCTNRKCLENNNIFAMEFMERQDILMRLEELEVIAAEQEQQMVEASTLYSTLLTAHHDASLKLTELGAREVEAKMQRNDVICTRIQLDQEIRKTEKAKTQLIEGALHQASTLSSELVFGGNQPSAHDKMKHNGTFAMTADGTRAWTCCNSHEANGGGCMEDHSVGVRSTLPVVKNFFNNQLTINHHLQHGSSLFLENSLRHSLQIGSAAFRHNESACEGVHEPNRNHMNSQHLGRGSSIDYFSVHKPAVRVKAMEPFSNKSIRTSSELRFGADPPKSTYIAELPDQPIRPRSGTRTRPATASPTLQRAEIKEVHPHLGKPIVKHQVEERLIGLDPFKPPPGMADSPYSSALEATKRYSLYSRPYSHANVHADGHAQGQGHGLFTQSLRTHSYMSSATRPQTAHATVGTGLGTGMGTGAGLGAGVGGHNASVVSMASWGKPVLEQSERDTPGPEESGKVSRESSHDSEESGCDLNFAPRFTSTVSVATPPGKQQLPRAAGITSPVKETPPGKSSTGHSHPHYLLPKASMSGHKSLIGKQRAVPERVKLTPNRPLASPDGYKIYTT